MAEHQIEQLWYTWSSTGLHNVGAGYRVRAASPGLSDLYGPQYQAIAPYLSYRLPPGTSSDIKPEDAPVSLALTRTRNGYILVHKIYVGQEEMGRTGNFSVHLLTGLPDSFSARDAIRLWGSSLWKRYDVPPHQQPTSLDTLSLTRLQQYQPTNQHFNFAALEAPLHEAIKVFLSPAGLKQRLLVKGHAQYVATLIWGITHSIPAALLPPEFTFSTYEHDISSGETIVGTITANELLASGYSSSHIECTPIPLPHRYGDPNLEEAINEFTFFALDCLKGPIGTSEGRSPELKNLIKQADRITSVKEFMALFRRFRHEKVSTQFINTENTLIQPDISAQATFYGPSETDHFFVDQEAPNSSTSTGILSLLAHLKGRTDDLLDRAIRRNRNIVLVGMIFLLLASNALTYCAASRKIDDSSIQATARVQIRATLNTQASQMALADASALAHMSLPNKYDIIGKSENSLVDLGQSFSLHLEVQNSGESTWSDQGGYQLVCIKSDTDPTPIPNSDCYGGTPVGLMGDIVPHGDNYVFIIKLTAPSDSKFKSNTFHTNWMLEQHDKPFGKAQTLDFTIKG